MKRTERQEARERLLDVLLEEEFAGEGVDAAPAGRAKATPRRWPRLLAAAAVLLGTAAVLGTAWLQRETAGEPAGGAARTLAMPISVAGQDPEPGLVEVKDRAHLEELLTKATAIELVRQEVVGAARVEDRPDAADRLELAPWPETIRVERRAGNDLFGRWTDALAGSLGERRRSNGVSDIIHLMIELPGDDRVRLFVSVDGESTCFFAGEGDAFVAADELRRLLVEANAEIERRHRVARGLVTSLAEAAALPATTTRLSVRAPATIVTDELSPIRELRSLREVCLRGEVTPALLRFFASLERIESLELDGAALDADVLAAVVGLEGLHQLTLRGCTGLDASGVRRLRGLKKLARLQCIDTAMGEDSDALGELVSLPALREFGWQMQGATPAREQLETLCHTKLERLLLVDLGVLGEDLEVLAGLPSLRDLTLVMPLHDSDLEALAALQQLRRLELRNASITPVGASDFRAARPDCELDWRLDARYFLTARAFDRW